MLRSQSDLTRAHFEPQRETRTRLRLRLARLGQARQLSHLEQIRALRTAVKKAGFSGSPKLSFGPAISVGHESLAEYLDLFLVNQVALERVPETLSPVLPQGYKLLAHRKVPLFFPSLESVLNVADYGIKGSFGEASKQILKDFLKQDKICIEKVKPSGVCETVDLKDLIIRMSLGENDEVRLMIRFGPHKTVKPERIVALGLGLESGSFKVLRKDLFSEVTPGQFLLP
ncbi:MAG: DUF2344 domain-containing protein [Elusimicrobia bacterium]|nr:DUF2344 domain-containing protein [Elusimicrobiota bacterium]